MGRIQDGETPPLLNPLILEIIFQHATFSDLSVYRQVCKQWYASCRKPWKSTVKVKLSITEEKNDLVDFLHFIENSSRIYTRRKPYATHYRVEGLSKNVPRFWKLLGSSIKSLELERCVFPTLKSFRRVIYKRCRNLEHLSLDTVTLKKERKIVEPEEWQAPKFGENRKLKTLCMLRDRNRCVSWMEILTHFPAIETLNVDENDYAYQRIFRTIHIIREHDSQMLRLKHLHRPLIAWKDDQRPDSLNLVSDRRLSFETLSVMLYGSRGTYDFLDVLNLHSATLRELYLNGIGSVGNSIERNPVLPRVPLEKLEVLRIRSGALPSMAFLKMTPNLRKLVFEHDATRCVAYTKFIDMVGFTLPSCTELEMLDDDIPRKILDKLVDWLPNLKTLKINGLDNTKFAMVCERWPNLVKLITKNCRMDDLGLSGMSSEDDILKNGESDQLRKTPKPNIANLKGLKYVSIEAIDIKPRKPRAKMVKRVMGYHMAAYAIGQLPSLKSLRIANFRFKDEALWKDLLAKYPWSPEHSK